MQIPALVKFARRAERRTILELGEVRVQTVEHLLAALAGLEIDNVRIELIRPSLQALMVLPKFLLKPFWTLASSSKMNLPRCAHPENLTAESEEQALVGLAPAKAGGLEVMYDLDYSREDGLDDGRIQRPSAALALTPETLPRRLPPLGHSALKKKQKHRQAGLGRHHREGTCWFGTNGPIATELRFPEEPARQDLGFDW